MTESKPVICTQRLNKIYEGAISYHALHDIDLEVQDGEMMALMGASGSGKSTLMNILGCLDRQSSGSYWLGGEEVTKFSDRELARIRNQRLGFVFQNFNLLPRYSALQNVELPLIYTDLKARERHQRATEALERVGLADRVNNRPPELSGGQKQRVAIARAMVNQPAILMADEPTGALDTTTSKEIMALFQQLHSEGLTLLIVTHEPDIAAMCQRILTMTDGRLTDDRRIEQVQVIL